MTLKLLPGLEKGSLGLSQGESETVKGLYGFEITSGSSSDCRHKPEQPCWGDARGRRVRGQLRAAQGWLLQSWPHASHPSALQKPNGQQWLRFFFFNSSMHLFFHMTCLRLGYVFKSIISDNHCWSNQVEVKPGWFWSLFLVACLVHCPLCVFLTKH